MENQPQFTILLFADLDRLGITKRRSLLRRWIDNGRFPQPIARLGLHGVGGLGWNASDVMAWLEKRRARSAAGKVERQAPVVPALSHKPNTG